MSTEARAVHFPAADWDGGVHPYRVGHRKLGMWLFIVSDSLTFSALLIGYAYLRASNVWPTPFPFNPSILFATLMTAIANAPAPSKARQLAAFTDPRRLFVQSLL